MSFRKIIFMLFFAISVVLAVVLYIIFRNHEKEEYSKKVDFYKKEAYATCNMLTKTHVEETIRIIDIERKLWGGKNEDSIKNHLLALIATQHFEYGGYVFVNTMDGQALVFDGKLVKGYKSIKDMTDPDGKRLFDMELDAASKPEGGYIYYKFKRMNDTVKVDKISFIKAYQDWDWIIGAGVYLPDITEKVELLEEQLELEMKKTFNEVLLLIGILLILSFLVTYLFSKVIHDEFEQIKDDLEDAMLSLEPMNKDKYRITNFRVLTIYINNLIERKRHAGEKAREAYKLLESVFHAARHIGFIVTSLEGKESVIQYVSDGTTEILNIKRESLIGKRVKELHDITQWDRIHHFYQSVAESAGPMDSEIKVKVGDGHFKHLNIVLYPRFDDDNTLAGGMMVMTDITKLKMMAEELQDYQVELEKKVEERTNSLEMKTSELEKKNKELTNINDLFAGREFRIKELREKIKKLEKQIKDLLNKNE